MKEIELLDTTLREGNQAVGSSLTVESKLRIAYELDRLGVHIIEGGWPGAIEKDLEFFKRAKKELSLTGRLAAFTSTRRRGLHAARDPILNAVIDSEVEMAVVFGKAWDLHVREVLRAGLEENLEMISDTIEYLRSHGIDVIFDAEHFFDGFKENKEYALSVLGVALESGARTVALADTNGGCLPHEVYNIVSEVARHARASPIGVHLHNDSGCAVANTIMAVLAGAAHVQVTVNGIGERAGNADLCQVVPNLELKLGIRALRDGRPLDDRLRKLTYISRLVYELTGTPRNPYQPYVGENAFAHKAGVHVDAVLKTPRAYEHIRPEIVGNARRFVVSDMSGRANLIARALEELGLVLDKNDARLSQAVSRIKRLESKGYSFDEAPASAMLVLLKALGLYERLFEVKEWHVSIDSRGEVRSVVRVLAAGKQQTETATGLGPVHAADNALRKALIKSYPELEKVRLVDYKVALLGLPRHTASTVRVAVTFTDGASIWSTTSVSTNIVEASINAIAEGMDYYLQKLAIKRKLKA
uniref:Citramalate synthase n=1 Tax=Fervidicoccus fontis TaxID=683846 RepID=A0A7J3ZM72_9CREN